eukprot:m.28818 g.28818  ORF g.28818 m.28818 type:complete len:368 (+) comp14211_c0_seq1:85-1188(+)
MTEISRVDVVLVDLIPMVPRSDAIQAFVKQETPIVKITCKDGCVGTGYTYTIGTGGKAITALLKHDLLPKLIGMDSTRVEHIFTTLFFHTHATAVGAITSLALAAIDTALWDLRCIRAKLPLWKMAGGAKDRIPVYSTEGGWLHLTKEELVENAKETKQAGFKGTKIKVGKPLPEDLDRLRAVRKAVGPDFEIYTDANQACDVADAIRRAKRYEEVDIAWLEEPLPAEDLSGHSRLCRSTSIPIAVGESIYSPSHFREYLQRDACSIIQVDVARIGGITPWLKTAHMAETFNIKVAPHFLMELHVSLVCAVPNSMTLEYIPQLDRITKSRVKIENGFALAPSQVGLGIEWDDEAIEKLVVEKFTLTG